MNFKLRTIKGESKKLRKEWVCKPYRIVWRSEVQGVKVSPAYHAMVRITINDSEMWDLLVDADPIKHLRPLSKRAKNILTTVARSGEAMRRKAWPSNPRQGLL